MGLLDVDVVTAGERKSGEKEEKKADTTGKQSRILTISFSQLK